MSKLVIHQLKKRSDFVRAARLGVSIRTRHLVLQAFSHPKDSIDIATDSLSCRVGYTVTKKVGNAVVRNRIKRRFRALAHDHLPHQGKAGMDYVLIGRKAALSAPYADLQSDMDKALKEVHGA